MVKLLPGVAQCGQIWVLMVGPFHKHRLQECSTGGVGGGARLATEVSR